MKNFLILICLAIGMAGTNAQESGKRNITPEDLYRMRSVSSPKISPDGLWVMYALSKVDSAKDRYESKLYMRGVSGDETIQLTDERSAGAPAWSPDNNYISFLSKSKTEGESAQLFLMNRKGGEPLQLTHIKGEINRYVWFSDGKKILMEITDPSTADTAKTKIRKPYEITRYHFKDDQDGYLDTRKTHLYVFDLTSKKLDTLTRGGHNEARATVSHDGKTIAYVSNISDDEDRNSNEDIFLLDMATLKTEQITTYRGEDNQPAFSPDDKQLLFNRSTGEGNFNMYELSRLFVYDLSSKTTFCISETLDRSVENAQWSSDGKLIYALVEDDRNQHIVAFDVATKTQKNVTSGIGVYSSIHIGKNGAMAALFSDSHTPNEIYIDKGQGFNRLTHLTDPFVASFKTVFVKGIQATTVDKNQVNGILYLSDSSAKNLPLVLFIHGGPVAQDDYGFDMSRQVLAGAGFAVAAVNYRGSSGRGLNYTKSIYGDWGNKEVKDIIAIADQLIRDGIADPNKLAIGGWSYGGILTNYTIATDPRFKAAVSGAGSSLQFSMYGSDQYITQYEQELGPPWKNPKKWMELSYPFFRIDKIRTPTLFMASEDDFNVPVIGAEQMYQAFKSSGLPTELVIYPNQHHGLRVPSYIVHRYKRHIDWYRKYLQ